MRWLGHCLIWAIPLLLWAQTQPLPYSHKKHIARGLQCRDCHVNPDPGEKMTFPATAKCAGCHSNLAKAGDIPWVRVYTVRAGTYWNHRSHLDAKVTCAECHGDVASLDVMTKLTNVTSMEGCISCHRERKAGTGCEFCHEAR